MFFYSYTPAVKSIAYSYPAKVAISAPAYSSAGLVTKYESTPAVATAGYSNQYSNLYGSYDYDASYTKGAYYSAPVKVLSAPVTKYVSTPTYVGHGPTVAPIACEYEYDTFKERDTR